MIEMLIALGVVALVSAYAVAFHVSTLSTVRSQANRQVAVQLVAQAMDRAHRDGGAAVLATPPPVRTTAVNAVTFTQRWTVTACRQNPAGGDCTATPPAAGMADLVHVVVAVQWREADRTMTERSAVLLSGGTVQPAFGA